MAISNIINVMQSDVIHRAKVLEISSNSITLSPEGSCRDLCGGCQLKVVCGAPGKQNDKFTVGIHKCDSKIRPGDIVIATATESTQRLAIMTQLIAPLSLMLVAVLMLSAYGYTELIAVGSGLSIVAVWYLLIWIFRRQIARHVKWTIRKV